MEQKQVTAAYTEAVRAIKEAILESRYRAARLVNKEILALYYAIGGYISVQSRAARWGSNAIGTISELLQQELPGLRGFSETSIKRMRIFYEAWCGMFENRPSATDDLQKSIIPVGDSGHIEIRPLTTDEFHSRTRRLERSLIRNPENPQSPQLSLYTLIPQHYSLTLFISA